MDQVSKKYPRSPYSAAGAVPAWRPAADYYTKVQIIQAIETASDVTWNDLLVGGRQGELIRARNAAYFYLHKYARPKISAKQVAAMLNRKDHTSVLHGEKTFYNDVEHDYNGARDLALRIVHHLNNIP